MRRRDMILGSFAATAVAACANGRPVDAQTPRPPTAEEHAATIAALRPPKRERPLIAIIAENEGTETTDFVVPYGALAASGVADVVAVATQSAPVRLMPALNVKPETDLAGFAERRAEGADYVIVPAMHRRDHPHILEFIREQHALGAIIVGVCSGAMTLSAAGLLADRAATGHWFDVDRLRKQNPGMRWVRDRRYVVDRGVATTTGVSASIPIALALVEAIAGRDTAGRVAREIGVSDWSAAHDSDAFRLDARMIRVAAAGRLSFWDRETFAIPIAPGVDEIALALTADAYARTYRSRAVAVAPRAEVSSLRGLVFLPGSRTPAPEHARLDLPSGLPAAALREALAGIEQHYGRDTADFVALQLEYPRLHQPTRWTG